MQSYPNPSREDHKAAYVADSQFIYPVSSGTGGASFPAGPAPPSCIKYKLLWKVENTVFDYDKKSK